MAVLITMYPHTCCFESLVAVMHGCTIKLFLIYTCANFEYAKNNHKYTLYVAARGSDRLLTALADQKSWLAETND